MRNKFNLPISIFTILFTGVFAANIFAQMPKTVTDFYLLMPNDKYSKNAEGKTIKGKAALTKFRKSLIKVEDISNGYLRLEEPGKVWSEMAIFKKKDGLYIVGQSGQLCPNCISEMEFYSYQNSQWTKITDKVLPDLTEEQLIKSVIKKNINLEAFDTGFMMPRKGRTLRIVCGECQTNDGTSFNYSSGERFKSEVDGKMKYVIFSWDWNGEKFVLNQD